MAASALPTTLESVSGIPVQVAGQRVFIKKLSLEQWVDLTKVAMESFAKMDDKGRDNAKAALKKAAEPKNEVGTLLQALNAETIAGLYSVVTGIDAKTLRETFSMAEFLNVIAALRETGELNEIAAAFSRAVKGWSPLSETSNQPSATSDSTEATAKSK